MSKQLRVKTGVKAGAFAINHNKTHRDLPETPDERGSRAGLRENSKSGAVHYSGPWPTEEGFMSRHLRVKTNVKAGGVNLANHNQPLIRAR